MGNSNSMKIGILGTRGIPNNYGGFEEFAQHMAFRWVSKGHNVVVYCEEKAKREVLSVDRLELVYIPGSNLPFINQIAYDFKCTRHALEIGCDIIYHAGYATSALGNLFFSSQLHGRLIYNMDGLEWKRTKFNFFTRSMIRLFERIAVNSSAELVSDNVGIQNYLVSKYSRNSHLIEYGSELPVVTSKIYDNYPNSFDLVIARFEPENNIEIILKAYESCPSKNLVIVANTNTRFYSALKERICKAKNIYFRGPVYNKEELSYLRTKCRFYIHGHSVGGTNPSLLEALVAGCSILIHGNEFNRDVVREFAREWINEVDLIGLIEGSGCANDNFARQISYSKERFDWEKISNLHLDLFRLMME